MKDFRQLKVWEKAHTLTLEIYKATVSFPSDERFGLTSQMRRCSSSIGANIAEGCGRSTDGDFCRFLEIAMGSVTELDYHLLLAPDLGYLNARGYELLQPRVFEVKSMLAPFIRKVSNDRRK
jgi:four helix bundle protein